MHGKKRVTLKNFTVISTNNRYFNRKTFIEQNNWIYSEVLISFGFNFTGNQEPSCQEISERLKKACRIRRLCQKTFKHEEKEIPLLFGNEFGRCRKHATADDCE